MAGTPAAPGRRRAAHRTALRAHAVAVQQHVEQREVLLAARGARGGNGAELEEDVFLNCVGTFGVTSAGYWWGRAGAAVVRLTHYLQGLEYMLWSMLYSDDEWLTGRTERYEIGLMLHMFILALLNAPLAWHKVGGGIQSDWVGYFLDVGRFEIGISASRAAPSADPSAPGPSTGPTPPPP